MTAPSVPPIVPPSEPEPFPPFGLARSERIYESPWVGLRRDIVLLPNGAEQEYHIVEISDAIVVVPVRADGSIVMIGQYRYPHGKTHWEVPAGRIHDEEPPEVATHRELREETGYRAGRLVSLPGFYPTNGISAHYSHAFVALDCVEEGPPQMDSSEQLIVRAFSVEEVERLIDAGRVADGFTAIAVMYYLRGLGKGRFSSSR
jgi:ADP-ribose pyrophosphatase